MIDKIIRFDGSESGPWYVSQSPNIMFSQDKEKAVVFNYEQAIVEATRNILWLNYPGTTMCIVNV